MSDMSEGRVFAIIPVFNRVQMTLQCIHYLKQQDYCGDTTIIVIDGGSTDSTVEVVNSKFPDVRLYSGLGELWWTDAVAFAIEKILPETSEKDYFFLVNNDTILRPGTINKLIRSSLLNNNAVVAATVQEKSGRMVAAGARMRWGMVLGDPIGVDDGALNNDGVLSVDVVFGRATLMPMRCIAKVGNFDGRRFPQYYGDSDFFLRVSRANIPVIVDFSVVVSCHEDESNTGIHYVESRIITLIEAWSMLTSKRSNLNLPDGWRFIWLHAPSSRKILCLSVLTFKNIKAVSAVYLRKYWVFIQMVNLLVVVAKKLRNMIQLLCMMTYIELREMGVDVKSELYNGSIYRSGIPHIYLIRRSFLKAISGRLIYLRFILRHISLLRLIRMKFFVRRWSDRSLIAESIGAQ